jgi:hypothetical protein
MWHVAKTGEVNTTFCGETSGKEPLARPRLDGRKILKLIFKKGDGEVWTGLIWSRIGAIGARF